jgi:hypothetical protein
LAKRPWVKFIGGLTMEDRFETWRIPRFCAREVCLEASDWNCPSLNR